MTASHASVAHIIADDAKKRFRNLRARYTRDKKKIKRKKKLGGADEVQDAKKETSELYQYLGWLDTHVTSLRRSKGNLTAISETSSRAGDSDGGDSSPNESDGKSDIEVESSIETSTSEEKMSKATGHAKWEKRDRKNSKKDVDNVEIEMLKCMTKCLKQPTEKQKNEDELFGSFIASQLKSMSPEQNAMAKYQINQICFQIKMSSMGMNTLGYSGSQNFQGFPSSQNFAQAMNPRVPNQTFLQEDQYTLLQ